MGGGLSTAVVEVSCVDRPAEVITEAGCSGQEGRRERRRAKKSNSALADINCSHFFCRDVPTDLARQD